MTEYSQFENSKVCGALGLSVGAKGSEVEVADSSGNLSQAGSSITATAAELNKLDLSANTLEVTTTAATAVTAGIANVEINISAGSAAITVADLSVHQGDFFIKLTGASTGGSTVTAAIGTWNGTNTIVTTNALNEALLLKIDSSGNGTVIENVGSVGLSGT